MSIRLAPIRLVSCRLVSRRLAAGALAVALGAAALAASAGPAAAQNHEDWLLQGITRAIVMPPEIGSNPANAECGLTEALIDDAVIGPVVASGLRTERLAVATPFTVDTPGVYLVPTVATLRDGPYMCVSWIALRAQSAQPLTLPSTGQLKTVQVLHWDRGLLLSDSQSDHAKAVAEAFGRLAAAFGQEWRAEQH